jgi:hypothetical protein
VFNKAEGLRVADSQVSTGWISIDGVIFQAAGDSESGRKPVLYDANHLRAASQHQIGFARFAQLFAGNQQLTFDLLMRLDRVVGDAIETVAAQVLGCGLNPRRIAGAEKAQEIGQPEARMTPSLHHGVGFDYERLRGHIIYPKQLVFFT